MEQPTKRSSRSSELVWAEHADVRLVGDHGEAWEELGLEALQESLGDGGRDDDLDLNVAELGDVARTLALRAFAFDGEERVAVSPDLVQ